MSEILFIIALGGGFLIPTAIFRQWWLFRVFMIFFVIFGLVEWWAVSSTDMSVSQHFWVLNGENPVGAWIIIGGMAVGWLSLLIHLKSKTKERK